MLRLREEYLHTVAILQIALTLAQIPDADRPYRPWLLIRIHEKLFSVQFLSCRDT